MPSLGWRSQSPGLGLVSKRWSVALEVALLEWQNGGEGLRLLGRSSDPNLVEAVREHLLGRLGAESPSKRSKLHLLHPISAGASSDSNEMGTDEENE